METSPKLPKSCPRPGSLAGRLILLSGLIMIPWISAAKRPGPAVGSILQAPPGSILIFVGDTQAPLFLETLYLRRDRNEEATQKILQRIAQEPDVAAFFHLGDITARGSEEKGWTPIDGLLEIFRKRLTPVFAVIGNHEYLTNAAAGMANFRNRFPGPVRSWFAAKLPPLGVIGLNSNFDQLSRSEKAEQQSFYETQLNAWEADPDLKAILVCCHHPPYTNSIIVRPSTEVVKDFVPPFLASSKTRLFLAGHSHAAEDFVRDGKHFLVSGGGGGLLHPLLVGKNKRTEDQFRLKTRTRFHHYLKIRVEDHRLIVTFEMLTSNLEAIETVHRIVIDY